MATRSKRTIAASSPAKAAKISRKSIPSDISESELASRRLVDALAPNLDLLIVGVNPGLKSAYHSHHYAGGGNHIWKNLHESGIVDRPVTYEDDHKLLESGIGFTNIVARPTRGQADLSRAEIAKGAEVLREKIKKYKPKIVCFNGKGIYEIFSGEKSFPFGLQSETLDGTLIYVMPSSSPRTSSFPTAQSKLKFYIALKKLKDALVSGNLEKLDKSEVIFTPQQQQKNNKNNQSSEVAASKQPIDGDTSSSTNESVIRSRYFLRQRSD